MEKCIIAAVAADGAIGIRGQLPWHISEDLKYFKRVTSGFPVIMGRVTYESIGRPLPGRKNIVITRSDIPGVCCVRTPEEAFAAAEPAEKCFIIGGAQLYGRTLQLADKLYITHVDTAVPGADAFFPEIDAAVWEPETSTPEATDLASGVCYRFTVYRRVL